jgi:uncharacterized protein DUF4234
MAQELQIRSGQDRVKIRSPWAVALLPIITLGIYHLVWWYRIQRELRDYGRAKGYDLGQSPANSVLALFPGALIIVPTLVTYWRGTKRVQQASRVAGKEPINGWITLILFLVVQPATWAYMQLSLNDLWRAEAQPLPGQALPPARSDDLPPRLPPEDRPSSAAELPPETSPSRFSPPDPPASGPAQ